MYHFRHYCDVDDEILGSGNLRNSLKASIQNEIDQQQQQKEKFNCFVDFRLSTVTMDPIFAHGSFDCRRCAGSTRFIVIISNYTLLYFHTVTFNKFNYTTEIGKKIPKIGKIFDYVCTYQSSGAKIMHF